MLQKGTIRLRKEEVEFEMKNLKGMKYMIRKIVKIDEEKCNGCGLCISACHEGALQLVDGKAKLVSESYCDGLGNCLPQCPAGAITLEEREAEPFDESILDGICGSGGGACESSHAFACESKHEILNLEKDKNCSGESSLNQWPCQIKLVPVNAPYFADADLLVAADCTAYAYANIHRDFMRNRITLIGCPKLDTEDYSLKFKEIFSRNNIKSITVLRMEVPCCGGIVYSVKRAIVESGKIIPLNVVTISIDGSIIGVNKE